MIVYLKTLFLNIFKNTDMEELSKKGAVEFSTYYTRKGKVTKLKFISHNKDLFFKQYLKETTNVNSFDNLKIKLDAALKKENYELANKLKTSIDGFKSTNNHL